jgi:hypothetical protein
MNSLQCEPQDTAGGNRPALEGLEQLAMKHKPKAKAK